MIRFDAVSPATAVLQMRGRARAVGGKLVMLVDSQHEGDAEISKFHANEALMSKATPIAAELLSKARSVPEAARTFLQSDAKSTLACWATAPPTYSTVSQNVKFVATVRCGGDDDDELFDTAGEPRKTRDAADVSAAYALCVSLHQEGRLVGVPHGRHFCQMFGVGTPSETETAADEPRLRAPPRDALAALNESGFELGWSFESTGPPHDPTHVAHLSCGGRQYVGSGRSKAIAKLAAAQSAVDASPAALLSRVVPSRDDQLLQDITTLLANFTINSRARLNSLKLSHGVEVAFNESSVALLFVTQALNSRGMPLGAPGVGPSKRGAKEQAASHALQALQAEISLR